MTDADQQAPAPQPSRWSGRTARLAQFAAAIVLIVLGGTQLINFLVLPGCDSSRITDTVRDIFKGQDVPLLSLDGIKSLPDTEKGKMCEAMIASADEKARIEYSVSWDGWSPYVRIETVETLAAD
jgi:hypothetical protein